MTQDDPGKKRIFSNYIIDRDFQLKFLLNYSLLIVFGLLLTVGFLYWLNYTKFDKGVVFRLRNDPVKVYQKGFEEQNGVEKEKFVEREIFLPDYDHRLDMFTIQVNGILLLSGLFLGMTAIFTVIYSHKMAGPVYNIKNHLRKLANGDEPVKKIKIRKGDEFQELADLLNQVIEKRINNHKS
ncbi:HAMP domain-containing protein [Leptospira kmetyi]|uniref:HAMP domain-containing protein n=1 Tax=Leptospira kmetyi TaxID=408139 RepID=A0ABX4N3I9_9LEPT|nr:methyl-accepting chemotaxis protein [Leptospira kmetyi]EQA55734.1 HAMP domain protein [Leptospira kmetyi serovar Malaysia str. Bejo-Iso9]PJZ27851.1 HAMP domain-containing protein [Leptospira kmetyi]PJZ41853.1 HAMP domain-containing protein [Leptospira kmetyi]TGK14938.1 methyl-accepting chemotaxis protein [Leptospira kmetyi]TGK33447.1 methyl-accepting chemotaxis protein [Leptospira kmetyi]